MHNEYQQSRPEHFSLEGSILVASKNLDSTCFARTIIYVAAHDRSGAVGIVVNVPIGHVSLEDIFSEEPGQKVLKQRMKKTFPVFFGGPVETSKIVILSMSSKQEQEFKYGPSVNLYTDVERFFNGYLSGDHNDKFIVTKGMALWDSYQLDLEVQENAWLVMDNYDPGIIFSHKMKNKWKKLIDLIGVKDFSGLVHYTGNS